MLQNIPQNLEILLQKLNLNNKYQEAIGQAQKKYKIQKFKIKNLTPEKITELFSIVCSNFYSNRPSRLNQPWHENQLKIFIWLVVGYSVIQNKCIIQFKSSDWLFFSSIFNGKDFRILEYEGQCLLSKNTRGRKWLFEQVQLFEKIVQEKYFKNRWNQIAKQLFLISNKSYFRTGKQCREYWNNHLNPSLNRSEWTKQEDFELLSMILREGKKWAKVAKMLGGKRTEHMIKNRYQSLYKFQKKNYYLQEETETKIIENLRMKMKQTIEENSTFHEKEKAIESEQIFDSVDLFDHFEGKEFFELPFFLNQKQ